jgi:hypothetical protein
VEPWWVATEPNRDARQNVVLQYGAMFRASELPALTTTYAAPGECTEARWMTLAEALKMELAFNHNKVLQMLVGKMVEQKWVDPFTAVRLPLNVQ